MSTSPSTDPDASPLVVSRDGAVATITLARPSAANAITSELRRQLLSQVRSIGADESVRAVIVTGSGRAFCAGHDLADHAQTLAEQSPAAIGEALRSEYNPIVTELSTMKKPVIAAVNGACAGAGLGLALACDLRVAGERARFSTAFLGIGLTADCGVSHNLVRAVGTTRAIGMLLLGTSVGADEAATIGLVHEVVRDELLLARVNELAAAFAAGPTSAYAATKDLMTRTAGLGLVDSLELEAEVQQRLIETADHQGAVRAFLEKRTPSFSGN